MKKETPIIVKDKNTFEKLVKKQLRMEGFGALTLDYSNFGTIRGLVEVTGFKEAECRSKNPDYMCDVCNCWKQTRAYCS